MIRLAAALGAAALCAPAFARPPSAAEQAAFVEKARQVALRYSDMLPDFVCTEAIHRSWGTLGDLRGHDAVTVQLTYFQKKENYKFAGAGKAADALFENYGGALSGGEFGSALRWIFEPESAAEFRWEKSASIDRKSVV